MPLNVELSVEANRQLAKIGDYIAEHSSHNAVRWLKKIHAAIGKIGIAPEVHAILYSPKQAGREVRQTFFGVYRNFMRSSLSVFIS